MPPPAEGLASRFFVGPAMRTQPDRRLVTLVHEGYEVAFEEIVRRYGRPLGRYAASIVGGRSEDVLQDAFAKALPALQREDGEIDLRPWLFRIVRNTALNELRDSPPSPELLAEALAGGLDPADELERREELADLTKRLQALPEPQRAAIVMRELEGLGHEEIAAALGLTDGGARQAIYRARQALRDSAGMLLPLPLVRFLVDHGGEAVGAGAGASGAIAAGASAGGPSAGVLKLGVLAAVLAGSVGAGVAVQQGHRGNDIVGAQKVPTVSSVPSGERRIAPKLADAALSSAVTGSDEGERGQGPRSDGGSRGDSSRSAPGGAVEVAGRRGGDSPEGFDLHDGRSNSGPGGGGSGGDELASSGGSGRGGPGPDGGSGNDAGSSSGPGPGGETEVAVSSSPDSTVDNSGSGSSGGSDGDSSSSGGSDRDGDGGEEPDS